MENEIAEIALKVVHNAVGRIVYCSVPITTGPRYFEWLKKGGDSDNITEKRKEIIVPNIRHARKTINQIRELLRCPVIDPTTIENVDAYNRNWTEEQFYEFWDIVIQNAVSEIVFLDGWNFSTGCSNELLSAILGNKPIFYQNYSPMKIGDAVNMVEQGLNQFKEFGLENQGLEIVYKKLIELSD